MKLIPQTMNMSCWYASAQMLINWRREITQSSELGINDPSEDAEVLALRNTNNGITDDQIVGLARKLGLELIPPESPTPDLIGSWLMTYGPLWVNGARHITVIAGILESEVLVYDPWPPNIGLVEWRSLDTWYIGRDNSSRDRYTDAGIFMHCP